MIYAGKDLNFKNWKYCAKCMVRTKHIYKDGRLICETCEKRKNALFSLKTV